jgi:signal peptidase I
MVDPQTTPPSSSDEARTASAARPSAIGEWFKSLVFAAVIFLVLRTFIVQTFVITSGSMENTLLVGDFLIVNRVAIGTRVPFTSVRIPGYSKPHRLDVLIFDPPHEPQLKLVKRLLGMPGDTIAMKDRVLYINGRPQEEPYVVHGPAGDDRHPWMEWQYGYLAPGVDSASYHATRDNWGPLVIPADRYLMLGDNREQSLDSRYWGLLEGRRLEGRAAVIYYSYDRDSPTPFAVLRETRLSRVGTLIR